MTPIPPGSTPDPPPRVAFVLGGGGRWGAVEVGMLRALVDAGVTPDLIVGTSIGAFNGAVFAADPTKAGIDLLRELWTEVQNSNPLKANVLQRARSLVRLRVAVQDPAGLRELLERTLPVSTFEDLEIQFECVAASIERAAEHWFTSGPLVDALMASGALPGVFPPAEINGEHFYDGGLVNSVPLDRAIGLGASQIYVLQVGRIEQPLRAPTKMYEPALIAFEIARRHRFGSLRDQAIPGVELHVLPSANDVQFDDRRQLKWSDFGSTDELIEGAYQASSEYLASEGSSS